MFGAQPIMPILSDKSIRFCYAIADAGDLIGHSDTFDIDFKGGNDFFSTSNNKTKSKSNQTHKNGTVAGCW